MPVPRKTLTVTVSKDKPIWRALTEDEVTEWYSSEEAGWRMPDGSKRRPPEGRLGSSDGVTQYQVISSNQTSRVFGHDRPKCAVIQASQGPRWFCNMSDLKEVPTDKGTELQNKNHLLATLAADREPIEAGVFEEGLDGCVYLVPYSEEQTQEIIKRRAERDAGRLLLAMGEFQELELNLNQFITKISAKYGLKDRWVGTLQIRIQGDKE